MCCSVLQRVAVCCSVLQCFSNVFACVIISRYEFVSFTVFLSWSRLHVTNATPCNTLQHTATHCNIRVREYRSAAVMESFTCHESNKLQQAASRCNTLQHTATHYTTLQHTATHCNTLQPTKSHDLVSSNDHTRTHIAQHTASHCNTLQHTATHCNTLQHTAAHCSALQLTHCNTLQHTESHELVISEHNAFR